jgi:N12 class adenine-specific DNA methylase
MGTLSSCLKKLGISEHEAAILRGSTEENKNDGDDARTAATRAVSDYLERLTGERNDIVSQIEKAGGKLRPAQTPEQTPAPAGVVASGPKKKASNNLIQRIKQLGGINTKYIRDVTGESVSPIPGLFSSNGKGLDDLANELRDDGFLINNDETDDGASHLVEMIQEAITGRPVLNLAGQQATMMREEADRQKDALREEIEAMGGTPGKRAGIKQLEAQRDKLRGEVEAREAEAERADVELANKINAELDAVYERQDYNGLSLDEAAMVMGYDKGDFDVAEDGADGQAEGAEGGARQAAPGAQGQGNGIGQAEAADGQPGAQDQGFALEGQTPEQIRAEADARAKRERDARNKEAADAMLDDFNLVGSNRPVDQAIANGQQELIEAPKPSANKVFTEDAAAAARALLKKKLGQLNAGIDPEIMQAGITLAGYHIEAGARTFAAYAKAMIEDLGDVVKPYLKSWYMGVKYDPRAADFDGLSAAAEVEAADVDAILKETGESNARQPESDQEQGAGDPGQRGRDNQPRSGQADQDGVAPASAQDVGEADGAGDSGRLGAGGTGGNVGGDGQVRAGGDAADGRQGAGRDGMADAGAGGRDGTADRASVPVGDQVPDVNPLRANYHIKDPEQLIGGTPKVRFARNKKAIEAYQSITSEGRQPTQDELDAMAGYIGWGSFGQELFQGTYDAPRPKDGWQNESAWLREHLGKEGWESAQASIINAHYTDPITVSTMWDMVRQLGFTGGRVLEPSMGVGNFFGLMPRDLMASSQLTGIEMETTTGGMAKLLYPEANIQIKPYQDSRTADGFYDLVIGNWPFAKDGPADRRYLKLSPSLHDFFFLKALDQTRPGGLVVGITSAGTMDKQGTLTRAALAEKADLVAAFRLPSGAFEKYAGTSVVTDIIILKKRDTPNADLRNSGWLNTTDVGTPSGQKVKVNEYFAKLPGYVLGTLDFGHGSTYGRPSMIVQRPADLEARMAALPGLLPSGIFMPATTGAKTIQYVTNNTSDRQQSIIDRDGELFQVQGEYLAPLNEVTKYKIKDANKTAEREDQIRRLVEMRRKYGDLIDAERDGSEGLEDKRKALKSAYDDFVGKYGPVRESFGLSIIKKVEDPFYASLAALEDNNGNPAAILRRPTIRAKKKLENPSVRDALVLARNESTRIDMARIAELAGVTENQAAKELVEAGALFMTPEGTFEVSDVYLSGNVRRKLREAEAAAEEGVDMARNIEALKGVVPKDTPYYNIEAKMGATWIQPSYYRQFVGYLLGKESNDIDVRFIVNRWKVRFYDPTLNRRPEATTSWGHPSIRFDSLLTHAIGNVAVKIWYRDADGNRQVDETASAEANEKANKIREAFSDWVWQDPVRKIELERTYNEIMNAIADAKFDGSFLGFEGMALQRGDTPFSMRSHQANAVYRGLVNRRGINAHEVGTGKTYTMGALAIESRRYGIAKKPLLLAHNANSASVAREINEQYPGAKVLYIDNLAPARIAVTLRQVAHDDWDLIVMPHSLINRLTLKEETLMEISRDQIHALEQEALEAANEDGVGLSIEDMDNEDAIKKLRSVTAKQLVHQRNQIIKKIKEMALKSSKEGAVSFEDMGVDMIIVDEAHEFKKPPLATRMSMKGLNKQPSNQSISLMFLTDYVKRLNGGTGVHLFTGTPITNTINEIYNMMRYVMDDQMARDGVREWDAWFNTFADSTSDVELTAAGEYEPVTRLAAFVNVPELRHMVGQYMDIVFADDMPEFKPRETATGKTLASDDLTDTEKSELVNGRTEAPMGRPYKKVINDVSEMAPEQSSVFEELKRRAASFKAASKKERREIMLMGDNRSPVLVETAASNAGLDIRLFDIEASDTPNNKVNRVVKNVMQHYNEHPQSTQVIFVDKGYTDESVSRKKDHHTGKDVVTKKPRFNLVKDIMAKLEAQGIPAHEIAIVDGGVSKDKRKDIADAMNASKIRVVIGQTDTLGVGVNMQENLRAMHHMDAPWMPGELEQRNGRGHRQGNKWNTVLEYRYITERIDGRRWQVLSIKSRFIKAFMQADDSVRVIEGDAVSLDEEGDFGSTLSDAAGDPRLLMINKLKADVDKLENKERMHAQGIYDAVQRIGSLKRQIESDRTMIERIARDNDKFRAVAKNDLVVKIGKKSFTDIDAANAQMQREVNGIEVGADPKEIANIWGFSIKAVKSVAWRDMEYYIDGELDYGMGSPSVASARATLYGLKKRIDDLTAGIADKEGSIPRMEEASNAPFAREADLAKKRKMLADLEQDIQVNPIPAPAWLRNGAPINTEVFVGGKPVIVEGHRNTKEGMFVTVSDENGVRDVPYLDVNDENGLPKYEEDRGAASSVQEPVADYTHGNQDPYATLETRPDTTEGQTEVGRVALAAAERRIFGRIRAAGTDGSLLGSRISSEFRDAGGFSIVGQKVESSSDLAILGQVYRDPRFETFRVFYVGDDGRIMAQSGFSSRLPATVYVPNDLPSQIETGLRQHGASGYWIMHNHPSGSSRESVADIDLTQSLMNAVPGFKGHVIIDHNEFTQLLPNGDGTMDPETIEAEWLNSINLRDNSEVPHKLLGEYMVKSDETARIAKQLQNEKGYMAIVGRNADGTVSFIMDMPVPAADMTGREKLRMLANLRRMARETGSTDLLAAVPGSLDAHPSLIASGLFLDVVSMDDGASAFDSGLLKRGELPETKSERRGASYVAQPVWHGTPHVWAPEPGFPNGRPRLDMIGTGEGAQAYGWGFYSAQAQGVGAGYQKTLTNRAGVTVKKGYGNNTSNWFLIDANNALAGGPFSTKKQAESMIQKGSLYQLDIPDDVLPYLLDFDAPIKKQSPAVLAALGIKQTTDLKGVPESVARDIEFVRDTLKTESVISKGFGSLDVNTRSAVVDSVSNASKNNKILDSIVGLIPVDVMDFLSRRKITPEMLFHDKAMLSNLLAVKENDFVASSIKGAIFSLADELTGSAAMVDSAGSGPAIVTEELDPANRANISIKHVPILRGLGQNATAKDMYFALSAELGSDKAASEYLASIGIVGNRYLDGNSRATKLAVNGEIVSGKDAVAAHYLKLWGDRISRIEIELRADGSVKKADREYVLGKVKEWASSGANVSEKMEGGTSNFVIWDQPTLDRVALLERNGEKLNAMREDEGVMYSRSGSDNRFSPSGHHGYLSSIKKALVGMTSDVNRIRSIAGSSSFKVMDVPAVIRNVIAKDGSKPFKRLDDGIWGSGSSIASKATDTHAASYHGETVSNDVVINLPNLLADPIAIFSSEGGMNSGSYRIVVPGAVVAIEPKGKQGYVMTVHPLNETSVKRWSENGLLHYYDDTNEKTTEQARNGQFATLNTVVDVSMAVQVAEGKGRTVVTKSHIRGLPDVALSLRSAASSTTPHTVSTLKSAIDQAEGNGFADRLIGTGNFEIITSGQVDGILTGGEAFSKAALPDTINVDGIDRPTTNSNGQPIHPTEEGIRNFWRWFGDSRVVDAEGRPLVVYHGAPDVRGIFAEGFKARSRGNVWFAAADRSVADSYALDYRASDYQNAEPQTIPLYIRASNPMIIDAKGAHWRDTEHHVEAAQIGQYDGIIIRNSVDYYNNPPKGRGKATTVYAWFDPTQAKSAVDGVLNSRVDLSHMGLGRTRPIEGATGNQGTFSPTNPDIRYSADGSRILAFVKNGKVYLVADNIDQNADSVPGLLRHEIGVHALQLNRSDSEFKAILGEVDRMVARGDTAAVAARKAVPDDTPAHLISEETLGYLVEHHPELSIVQRFQAWLKNAIRNMAGKLKGAERLKLVKWANNLTPEDVAWMAGQALKTAPDRMGQAKRDGDFMSDRDRFFSPLIKAFQSAPDRIFGQPAKQVLLWLQSNKAKLGLKDDEIQWSGITDYLNLRGKEKVTKAEVLDYLNGNGVTVQDVVKGAGTAEMQEEISADDVLVERAGAQWYLESPEGRNTYVSAERIASEQEAKEFGARYFNSHIRENNRVAKRDADDTKFSGYWDQSFKGGIEGTYREILVTLPDAVAKQKGVSDYTVPSAHRYGSRADDVNRLVHVRLDEVTGADGKRYVRVGEIQSDWGQEGRDKGFGEKATPSKLDAVYAGKGIVSKWYVYPKSRSEDAAPYIGKLVEAVTKEDAIAKAHVFRIGKNDKGEFLGAATSAAPFVTDTRAWVALGIKRAILHAIDVGADGIVFGTGQQNADLYDLSKQVDRVAVTPTGGVWVVTAWKDGASVLSKDARNESELAEIVGKDLAERAISENGGDYSGLDLRVGGEGMRKFYDSIVPSVANEVLRKLSPGTKVESKQIHNVKNPTKFLEVETDLTVADISEPQPGFTIPDSMREKIRQSGMPLFSKQTPPPGGVSASRGRHVPTLDIPEETAVQASRRVVQDSFLRFQVVQDYLNKTVGADIRFDDRNVYEAELRSHGRMAARISDFRRFVMTPLVERVHKAGFTMEDVAAFLHAEHAPERNAHLFKINPALVDSQGRPNGAGGMTDDEAAQIIAAFKAAPNYGEMVKLAGEFRDISSQAKEMLHAAGIVSTDRVNAWSKAFQKYVPLRGGPDNNVWRGTGKGKSVNAKPELKRTLGHGYRDEWIIENIFGQYERAVILSEKNEIFQHLYRLAGAQPFEELWTVDQPEKMAVLRKGATTHVVYYKGAPIKSFATQSEAETYKSLAHSLHKHNKSDYTIHPSYGDDFVSYIPSSIAQPYEAIGYINGERVRIQLNDPLLAQAYNNLEMAELGFVMRQFRDLNNTLSLMYTGLNPAFIIVNIERDLSTGLINTMGEYGTVIAAKMLTKYPVSFYRAMAFEVAGHSSPIMDRYRRNGGSTGVGMLSDMERLRKDAQSAYDHAIGFRLFKGNPAKMSKVMLEKGVSAAFAIVRWVNAGAENAMRIAAFTTLIEEGYSENEAINWAKRITVNFNKQGEQGQNIKAAYLFANPAIQGATTTGQVLFGGRHKYQAWSAAFGLAMLGYLAASQWGGDDEDKEEVQEYEKQRNFLIKMNDLVAKVAIPYGYGFFSDIGRYAKEMQDGASADDVAYKLASSFMANFLPFNPLGDEPDYNTAMVELMPFEPIKWAVGIGLNNTGFGDRKIYPDDKFDEGKPDSAQMWRSTRGTVYEDISTYLNEATGGTATQRGGIDIHPDVIKWMFGNLTGGVGTFISGTGSAAYKSMQGTSPELSEIPVVRNFIRERHMPRNAKNAAHEAYANLNAFVDDYERAKKYQDEAGLNKFTLTEANVDSAKELLKEYQAFNRAHNDALEAFYSVDNFTERLNGIRQQELDGMPAYREHRKQMVEALKALQQN